MHRHDGSGGWQRTRSEAAGSTHEGDHTRQHDDEMMCVGDGQQQERHKLRTQINT
jgi:hypothetical protein